MKLDPKNLLVDGKRIGDVINFQLTYQSATEQGGEQKNLATVFYTIGGKQRTLTCELEAISFE